MERWHSLDCMRSAAVALMFGCAEGIELACVLLVVTFPARATSLTNRV